MILLSLQLRFHKRKLKSNYGNTSQQSVAQIAKRKSNGGHHTKGYTVFLLLFQYFRPKAF
jgi:hypothetical protein